MENSNIDYQVLLDDAKLNLSNKLNEKIEEYKNNPTAEKKREIAILINDRQQLFLFNKKVIEKYL